MRWCGVAARMNFENAAGAVRLLPPLGCLLAFVDSAVGN
jgi:hypothetical protein